MPLNRKNNKKRFHSSDSDSSSVCETPKKSSIKRLNANKSEQQLEDMNQNNSNNFDIRLSNGRVNGISVENTSIMNASIGSGLNPVVSLNRDTVERHIKRKSLVLNSVSKTTPINENEENRERRMRQNERAKAQRRSISVNPTPGRVGSTSVAVNAMNSHQLREHYTHCIQLSTTNKINTKNAFGLYLIDYMSELIKEKQSQSNGFVNFKLAGSALDAGAKIYCNRVDSVHAEAQKVASSLVMALDTKNGDHNENLAQNNHNEDNEQNDDNNDEENSAKSKRKKSKKNVKTLALNIDVLNVEKLETNLEIDPVFHHLSQAFDMGNVSSLFMANLKMSPSGMLLLDPNSSLNFDSYLPITQPSMQSITNCFHQMEDVLKSTSKICAKLSTFEFLNRECALNFLPREEDPSFTRRDSFTFDLNAEVEDVEDMGDEDIGGGDVFDDGIVNCDDFNSDDGGPDAPETINKSQNRAFNLIGVGDLVKMLSDKPNDYTYFNSKLLSTWAGPQHWKRVPVWHRKSQTDGETAKTRRQRKQYEEVDYIKDVIFDDQSCKTGSSEIKLKVQTLERWQSNHIDLRLPSDHGFDPKDLAKSFIRPESTFQCAKSHEEILDTSLHSNDNSFGALNSPGNDRYDYDDDDIDVNTGGFTETLGQSAPLSLLNPGDTGDTFPFVGDNLVEEPYDLQQYNVQFAKFAKKMDIKKLKRAMWDVINPSTEPSTPITTHEMETNIITENINFGDLYQTLPKKITPVMATNLSVPIAFVTLLHLVNERNLCLVGREDLEDFSIQKELPYN